MSVTLSYAEYEDKCLVCRDVPLLEKRTSACCASEEMFECTICCLSLVDLFFTMMSNTFHTEKMTMMFKQKSL